MCPPADSDDRARLRELAARAEQWLLAGIAQIGPIVGPNEKKTFRKLKATVELLLLELHAGPHPSPAIISALRDALARANVDGALLRHLWDHPELDALSRCCMGLMVELGLLPEDAPLMRATCGYLDRCYRERFPFRSLETSYLSRKFKQSPGEPPDLLQEGTFLGHLFPRTLTDEYGLTHALFYATDFGRNPGAFASQGAALPARIEKLCAESLTLNNIDVLSEHLLCLRYLGREKTSLALWYAQQICERVEEGGYWRGPASLAATLEKEELEPTTFEFFENYHTTLLVRVFLRGLLLQPPDDKWEAATPAPPMSEGVLPRTVLSRAMRGEAGEEAELAALLGHAASAHLCLMAYLQMLRLRALRGAEPLEHAQIDKLLRRLASADPGKRSPRICLIQALARSILGIREGKLNDDGDALLHEVEQGYRRVTAGMPSRDGDKARVLRSAADYLCAAAAICAPRGRRLPPLLQVGAQALLSRALRTRDLGALCHAIWAHALTGETIDDDSLSFSQTLLLAWGESMRPAGAAGEALGGSDGSAAAALEICAGLVPSPAR